MDLDENVGTKTEDVDLYTSISPEAVEYVRGQLAESFHPRSLIRRS